MAAASMGSDSPAGGSTSARPSLAMMLDELRELLQARSISHGDFTLASGAKSTYYCNSKTTLLSPRGALLIGNVLCERLRGRRVEALGGLAMGAAYISPAVSLASDALGMPIFGFTVRADQKQHGLKQRIDEAYSPDDRPLLCPGRRVVVVDDVVTAGGSILKAIEAVRERGCEIVTLMALVDRNGGGRERLKALGVPYEPLFETDPNGWLRNYPV